jgi:hypothetical protein
LVNLKSLDLRYNKVCAEDAQALKKSPYLAKCKIQL